MKENLSTYLNDHLAGSVAALALINDMGGAVSDTSLKDFLSRLKDEIEGERHVLRIIMQANAIEEGSLKKATAWLGEKLASPKFGGTANDGHGLAVMQGLEMLCLGITGKLLGWRAFQATIAPMIESLGFDLGQLQQQAERQRSIADEFRLAYARKAFA